ncbi:MAG: UDP-3-O-(3-hydroxymyristoyl)glucosamine N-acyltransferase [Pseudomonadota bacterium]|nr:UDP-3-O-(3-hydroxymyristoyl)glucosamine N-acyltransferase [Pseudomonadota bacterium]
MPDPRFYEPLGPVSLGELAEVAGAELAGADDAQRDRAMVEVAPLARAGAESVSFFADRRYRAALRDTGAGACFMPVEHLELAPEGCARLVTREPHAAFARAASRLHRARRHLAEGRPIHAEAQIEEGVTLSPGVVVGPGARIGAGTVVGGNAVIGPGVVIGRDCRIGANATVLFAVIADRVRILSGAVIGEAGFGVTTGKEGVIDVPQLGRVIIEEEVTVGANTTVDRGAWDDTVIGAHTKIDNLVQIAHNVRLGRNCMLAAHTGISGSVVVGDGAVFGGRAGIADHLEIGAGARIAAAAGVMKDVPPGEMWVGSPARPIRRFMRETAWLARAAKGRDFGRDGEGRRDGDDGGGE